MMTTFSKKEETLKNQIKVGNYHATYEDVADVFSKIKNKGILNETIILNGRAKYKSDRITLLKSNKKTNRKAKKHIKKEEEFEL